MSETDELVRDISSQLQRLRETTASVVQGVIVSVETNLTCTCTVEGGTKPVPGFRWLLDAYTPVLSDVVWIINAGPTQRFILGAVNPSSIFRGPLINQSYFTLEGIMSADNNNENGWTDNFLTNSTGETYNQSPGTSVIGAPPRLNFYPYFRRGGWKLATRFLMGPNLGIMAVILDDTTVIESWDTYASAYTVSQRKHPVQVNIYAPGTHKITIQQQVTKNAASTGYFVLWIETAAALMQLL